MKKADVEEFFYRLATADPEPKTELQYVNGLCCKHGARPRGVTQLGD